MKRLFIFIAFMLVFQAQSVQAKVRFGVKGGVNISQLKLNDGIFEGTNRMGFLVGPTVEFGLTPGFLSLDASLLYDNFLVGMKSSDEYVSETLQYVDLPVNLNLTFGWERVCKIYVSTGPQLALNVGKIHVLNGNYSLDNTMLSWNFGLGFRLFHYYHVGYTYNIGIGYTAELTDRSVATVDLGQRLYSPTHKVSFTYFF